MIRNIFSMIFAKIATWITKKSRLPSVSKTSYCKLEATHATIHVTNILTYNELHTIRYISSLILKKMTAWIEKKSMWPLVSKASHCEADSVLVATQFVYVSICNKLRILYKNFLTALKMKTTCATAKELIRLIVSEASHCETGTACITTYNVTASYYNKLYTIRDFVLTTLKKLTAWAAKELIQQPVSKASHCEANSVYIATQFVYVSICDKLWIFQKNFLTALKMKTTCAAAKELIRLLDSETSNCKTGTACITTHNVTASFYNKLYTIRDFVLTTLKKLTAWIEKKSMWPLVSKASHCEANSVYIATQFVYVSICNKLRILYKNFLTTLKIKTTCVAAKELIRLLVSKTPFRKTGTACTTTHNVTNVSIYDRLGMICEFLLLILKKVKTWTAKRLRRQLVFKIPRCETVSAHTATHNTNISLYDKLRMIRNILAIILGKISSWIAKELIQQPACQVFHRVTAATYGTNNSIGSKVAYDS